MATNKNITMKQFNGTDYDTLYPKTIASQIPDVYSKSETYPKSQLYTQSQLYTRSQLYTQSQLYTRSQIDSMMNAINNALDGKVRIQTGSYVGTGTYGANNPCSLTFDFVPKVVYISKPTDITIKNYTLSPYFIQMVNGSPIGSGAFTSIESSVYYYETGDSAVSCSFNDKTVSWYNFFITRDTVFNESINQMNNLGTTYHYTAIG